MGNITRTSAAPPPQQVVFLPPPPPTTVVSESSNQSEKSESEIAAEARTQSLLRRSRGRFGTILTGFKGFLQQSQKSTQRKTLLGE